MNMHQLFNRSRQRARTKQQSPRRRRPLWLEPLEDRITPTVKFPAVFGAEHVNISGNVLSSAIVELIFWGPSWTDDQVKAVANEANVIVSGPYLNGLQEYGSNGRAIYGGYWIDRSHVSGTGNGDVDDEVHNAIDNSGDVIPGPGGQTIIYAVITDPADSATDYGGRNQHGSYDGFRLNEIYASTRDGMDLFGDYFSHEMAEDMSDPSQGGDGVQVSLPDGYPNFANNGDQIADNEPAVDKQNHYQYRIGGPGGAVVQPFCSGKYGAYIVDDGGTQTITATAQWSLGYFNGKYDLSIPVQGTATLDEVPNVGLEIDLNGETFFFDWWQVESISVYMPAGDNTVNVEEMRPWGPISIVDSGGNDQVNVAPTLRNLDNIQGAISVYGIPTLGGRGPTINIYDQKDMNGQNWAITNGSIARTGASPINYSGQSAINIHGGSGGETFDVQSTASPTALTIDSDDAFLFDGSVDTVNIGSLAPDFGGTVANIAGPVYVNNFAGITNMFVDNSGDTTGRTIQLTNQSITGNWPAAPINYTGGQVGFLQILGGQGGNLFNVQSTAAGTNTNIDCDDHAGGSKSTDGVNVGSQAPYFGGSLANIAGPINISNTSGYAYLNVDDSGDQYSRTVTVTDSSISGTWSQGAINYVGGEVLYLDILGGWGDQGYFGIGDVFSIQSTAAGTFTFLQSDYQTNRYSFDGVIIGSSAPDLGGTLDGIAGPIEVWNQDGQTGLSIDDSDDQFGKQVQVTNDSVTGNWSAPIYYVGGVVASLTLYGGLGGDSFNVLSTAAGTSTTIISDYKTGIYSTDDVRIGSNPGNYGGTLADIAGPVHVNNYSGQTYLTLDDSGDIVGRRVKVTDRSVAGTWSGGDIDYGGGVSFLYLVGGSGDNRFNVQSTAGSATTLIDANFGAFPSRDTVTIGSKAPDHGGTLAGIDGAITVVDAVGKATLVVDDSGDSTRRHVTITDSSIAGDWSAAAINYSGGEVSALHILGGTAVDTYHVESTAKGTSVLLDAGTSANVMIGLHGSVRRIHGNLNVESPTGFNTITVDDSADPKARTVTLSAPAKNPPDPDGAGDAWGQIKGLAPARINYEYTDTSSVTIDGGMGNNQYYVQQTGLFVNVTLNTGTGTDTVDVGNGGTMDDIMGPITVNGQGYDTLNVDDGASKVSQTYYVSATSIQRGLRGAVNYSNMQQITLNGSSARSTYDIDSTVFDEFYTINAGKRANTFNVGYLLEDLNNVQGTVTIFGGGHDALTLNDQFGTATGYYVDSSTANPGHGVLDLGEILYFGMATVTLNGSQAGGSAYDVAGTAAGTSYAVNAGSSTDTLTLTPAGSFGLVQLGGDLGAIAGPLAIKGHGGPLTINDKNDAGNNGYAIGAGTFQRTSSAAVTYTNVPTVTLDGGSGTETFQVGSLPTGAFTVVGGAGVNTLDYSAYTGDITVDLPLGSATGLAGISGIRNVTGSIGNDILVGDANANVLTGGTGRNLIIGGKGADTIVGKTGEDLVIGDYTDYDANIAALDAVMAEWLSADSYATRVSDISRGGGLNGAYVLNNTTVHNDLASDAMTGGAGRDWFFASAGDIIKDLVSSGPGKEQVTSI
jgi:hypothetical protein